MRQCWPKAFQRSLRILEKEDRYICTYTDKSTQSLVSTWADKRSLYMTYLQHWEMPNRCIVPQFAIRCGCIGLQRGGCLLGHSLIFHTLAHALHSCDVCSALCPSTIWSFPSTRTMLWLFKRASEVWRQDTHATGKKYRQFCTSLESRVGRTSLTARHDLYRQRLRQTRIGILSFYRLQPFLLTPQADNLVADLSTVRGHIGPEHQPSCSPRCSTVHRSIMHGRLAAR
jgi:hypothetical protein